jgi:uncharacterized membrane protein (UPF0127 family)
MAKEMHGLSRGIGLMFRNRNTDNLLFAFSTPSRVAITSWFVFFPFLAIWLDKNKKVTEFRVVNPFIASFQPKKNAKYLLEVPINAKNSQMLKNFAK